MHSNELAKFNEVMANHYQEYLRKMKQWCFQNSTTWSEDIFQDTYYKCADLVSRKGLKDSSEQGILNYFFQAFKRNIYQEHQQKSRRLIDENIDPFSLIIEADNVEELEAYKNSREILVSKILQAVRENFEEIDYHIFRLRYLFQKDGKYLNYKQIKQITKVGNTKSRLVAMNNWVRANIKKIAAC